MLKHSVKLDYKVGDKEGCFICDNDTPITVAREMLCQFLKQLGYVEDQALAQQQAELNKQEQGSAPQE